MRSGARLPAASSRETAGSCNLYLWPFGVALFHLVEDLTLDCVAQLAVWRRVRPASQNMYWAHDQLRALTGREVDRQPYVTESLLGRRARMAGPRPPDRAAAPCAFAACWSSGQDDIDESCLRARRTCRTSVAPGQVLRPPRTRRLRNEGHLMGYASWSGVVYYPIARDRALHENELITCELSPSASRIRPYCDYLQPTSRTRRRPNSPHRVRLAIPTGHIAHD